MRRVKKDGCKMMAKACMAFWPEELNSLSTYQNIDLSSYHHDSLNYGFWDDYEQSALQKEQ